jgi:hypothetical protein
MASGRLSNAAPLAAAPATLFLAGVGGDEAAVLAEDGCETTLVHQADKARPEAVQVPEDVLDKGLVEADAIAVDLAEARHELDHLGSDAPLGHAKMGVLGVGHGGFSDTRLTTLRRHTEKMPPYFLARNRIFWFGVVSVAGWRYV